MLLALVSSNRHQQRVAVGCLLQVVNGGRLILIHHCTSLEVDNASISCQIVGSDQHWCSIVLNIVGVHVDRVGSTCKWRIIDRLDVDLVLDLLLLAVGDRKHHVRVLHRRLEHVFAFGYVGFLHGRDHKVARHPSACA